MIPRLLALFSVAVLLAACSQNAAPPTPTLAPTSATTEAPARSDLGAIKTYLIGKTGELKNATAELQQASDAYYALAREANFDYAALWSARPDEVRGVIERARAAWTSASPLYEQMEGIVAGTPSLAQFDVDLDAGSSAADDPDNAVSFDVSLPDGRTLARPGNLFGVTESTLWGTYDAFRAPVEADLDSDGALEFGEALPDANVLKGATDLMATKAGELEQAAASWTPTESDAFTALAVMIPTMNEYFGSWKDSRFVSGSASTQRDFVAISRLADIQGILSSLEIVHDGVSPRIQSVDPAQDQQIRQGLSDLKGFVGDIYTQEQGGKRFSPEEADTLGAEAQNRATAITGQVTQVAAQLGISIQE
jgi:hypothetical protein